MMKKYRILAILALFTAINSSFAETWVKVSTGKSGIYSVTYDELRAMGFNNPSEVGVAGRGAKPLTVAKSVADVSSLSIVPVIHDGNQLIFYAIGPEQISFNSSDTGSGYFVNSGTNTNVKTGVYFLTDNPAMYKEMATDPNSYSAGNATILKEGIKYYFHELDLYHNNSSTGVLFWGENFLEKPSYSWPANLPDAIDGCTARMDVAFYTERKKAATLTFGTDLSGGKFSAENVSSTSSYMEALPETSGDIKLSKGLNKISMTYENIDGASSFANLDYWIISYPSDCSYAAATPSGQVAFPGINKGADASFSITSASPLSALDITDPANPFILKSERSGNTDKFYLHRSNQVPEAIFFNGKGNFNKISQWEKSSLIPDEQPLREMAEEGADFLIISTSELLEEAEAIANLHRQYDGIKVVVTDINSVYSEFSEGLPDPEAYRRLAILFYNSKGTKLKNLLLVGPYYNDPRGIRGAIPEGEFHISPQSTKVSHEYGAYTITDYFAEMTGKFDLSRMESATLGIGIGVLPFYNKSEAIQYINKLERYMTSSHLSDINNWLYLGGTGDNHTHDQQCVDLHNHVNAMADDSVIGSVLAVDAYGYDNAKKKFIQYISSGKGVIIYFGHAGNTFFEKNSNFFTTADISSLNNAAMPFLITAGCSTTGTDMGVRGMGEEWVLGTKDGAIGAMATTRETWSTQNYEFMKSITDAFVLMSNGEPMTIGEVIKAAKNTCNLSNDLAFILICDPALKIGRPEPNVSIDKINELVAGSSLKVSGSVTGSQSQTLKSFNGNAMVKIALPETNLLSQDIVTLTNNKELYVTYGDRIIATGIGEVKNGTFEIDVTVPTDLSKYAGEECFIYISCENPGSGHTGVGAVSAKVSTRSASPASDKETPVIEDIYYDSESSIIYIVASDNQGISLSNGVGFKTNNIRIDGTANYNYSIVPVEMKDGSKNVTLAVSVPTLSEGQHSVVAEIYDINGNKATSEFMVNVGNPNESILLSLNEKAVTDDATFSISGGSGSYVVVIRNSSNKIIRKIESKSSKVVWDRLDFDGNKVGAGLYKASVIDSQSQQGVKKHSRIINIPVI